jgi:hypothetical protein
MNMESHGGIILTGETEQHGEKSVCATLTTTNPLWTNPDANPNLGREASD